MDEQPKTEQQIPQPSEKPMITHHARLPKKIWALIIILVAGGLLAGAYLLFIRKDSNELAQNSSQSNESQQQDPEDNSSIRLLATGDFIAHDAINAEAKQAGGGYDYSPMMAGMKSQFADADINFCNLATLAGGEEFGISGYPVFNAPTEWTDDMDELGCNVYNTGTNHTNDKGQGPITAELNHLDGLPDILAHAGANRSSEEQSKVKYFEVKGVKFALVSYSTYSNSPNPNPYSLNRFVDELVVPQMTEARLNADIVIASMRWGTEYSETLNAAQETQSQKLADLGADIILGHGTHTLQPVKKLTGTLPDGNSHETIVWYGLGNFLNAQLETTGLTGCVADMRIDVASKKVTSNMCLPFYMHYEWTAEEKAAEDLLARKNFLITPLYSAQELIAKSQLDTTVDAQMERVRGIVNAFTEVPVENAEDL